MKESNLKRRALEWLRRQPETWCVKIERARAGTPDILGCRSGRFFAVELKRPDGVLTPIQEHELGAIARARGVSRVARTIDDVKILWRGLA